MPENDDYEFFSGMVDREKAFSLISSWDHYHHGAIIRIEITCKKIPYYIRDSACKWFIVKKANNCEVKYCEVMLSIFEFSQA